LEWSCVSFHATSEKFKFFTLTLSRFTSGRQNDGIYTNMSNNNSQLEQSSSIH
jgi:hypothetical protein